MYLYFRSSFKGYLFSYLLQKLKYWMVLKEHKPSAGHFLSPGSSVSVYCTNYDIMMDVCSASRRCMCTRRRYRPWSTPFRAQRRTTFCCGLPRHPPTVTSARGCCGESRARESAAQSAGSSVTKSARTCWMRTACRVSDRCSGGGLYLLQTRWLIDEMTDLLTGWPTDELTDLSVLESLEHEISVSCTRYGRKLNFPLISIRACVQNVNPSHSFGVATCVLTDRQANTQYPHCLFTLLLGAQNVWISFCRGGREEFETWRWGQGEQHHHSHEGTHEEERTGKTGNLRADQVGEISRSMVRQTGMRLFT